VPKMKWTAELRRKAALLAERGCIITGAPGVLHHEKHGWEKRDHNRIVCLRHDLHLERHAIGLEAFNEKYDVDLRKEAGYE